MLSRKARCPCNIQPPLGHNVVNYHHWALPLTLTNIGTEHTRKHRAKSVQIWEIPRLKLVYFDLTFAVGRIDRSQAGFVKVLRSSPRLCRSVILQPQCSLPAIRKCHHLAIRKCHLPALGSCHPLHLHQLSHLLGQGAAGSDHPDIFNRPGVAGTVL